MEEVKEEVRVETVVPVYLNEVLGEFFEKKPFDRCYLSCW